MTETKKGRYYHHKFHLTRDQIEEIKKALESNEPIKIKIKKEHLVGETPLPLTESEHKEVMEGNGLMVDMNKAKMNHIKSKEHKGGFLPLLALIPAILGGLGALGGIAGGDKYIVGNILFKVKIFVIIS